MRGNICVIPARGGSKRIPRKNVRLFCGRPIIAYAIEAALQSGCFEEVMVSTEDDEIRTIAMENGATVPFLRSKRTAEDHATSFEVWQEVLAEYKKLGKQFELVVSIYPTSPFTTADRLREAVNMLETNSELEGVIPLLAFESPVQRAFKIRNDGCIESVWPENDSIRTQDLETFFHDSGQYYAFRSEVLGRVASLRDTRRAPVVLGPLECQDIDTEEDWALAEMKFRQLLKRSKEGVK